MTASYDDQIREWVQNGRISKPMADALLDHYSKQADPSKKGSGDVPVSVDLMELMNLIDLLEKKEGVQHPAIPHEAPSAPSVQASGLPEPFLPEDQAPPELPPDLPQERSGHSKIVSPYEELEKKCQGLEAELAAEKKAHAEFSEKEFAYAKRFADAEEKRRQAQADEEGKRKSLEAENHRLAEELKHAHEEEARLARKIGGLEILIEAPRAQVSALEQKCAEYQNEIARLEKARSEREADFLEQERLRGLAAREEQRSENEKERWDLERKNFAEELAGRDAEIAGLQSRLQEALASVESVKAQSLALEASLQEANGRFEMARSEKERSENEKQTIAAALTGKDAEIAGLQSHLKEAVAPVVALRDQILVLEGENQHLGMEIRDRAERIAALEQEKELFSQKVAKMSEAAALAEARIKELEESANQTVSQLEELRKRCVELENEAAQLRSSFDEKVRLEEELKRGKEMLAKAQARSKYLEETLLALEKQIDSLS